jgi:transposase
MPDTVSTREGDERILTALRLLDAGMSYDEIAKRLGYKTAAGVRGVVSKIRAADREAENA